MLDCLPKYRPRILSVSISTGTLFHILLRAFGRMICDVSRSAQTSLSALTCPLKDSFFQATEQSTKNSSALWLIAGRCIALNSARRGCSEDYEHLWRVRPTYRADGSANRLGSRRTSRALRTRSPDGRAQNSDGVAELEFACHGRQRGSRCEPSRSRQRSSTFIGWRARRRAPGGVESPLYVRWPQAQWSFQTRRTKTAA
jgi:hypothetical protein